MRKKHQPPNVPFVEAYHKGGRQNPTAIIIRSSDTTSDKGAALAIANTQRKVSSPHETYHYIVDAGSTYRCVPDRIVAGASFHCAEPGAIQILMCVEWLPQLAEWDDQKHAKVLERTVDLVAQLALAYKISTSYADGDRWQKWRRRSRGGIIIQVNGAWPWSTFASDVKARVETLKQKV